ncbi:methenyltetrahydromethanopterin cyclohydrolase [Methanofollis fontis]|nr:methenyltetrahydromethanopterin cyclohydrolase [Methanofollis fontis]
MAGLNEGALPMVKEMTERAALLGIRAGRMKGGAMLIDCGSGREVTGSYEAGCRTVEAACGGCARAWTGIGAIGPYTLPILQMNIASPADACLGALLPLWKVRAGGEAVSASGPGRALARRPPRIYQMIEMDEQADDAVVCLDAGWFPDDDEAGRIAEACGVGVDRLTIILAPASGIAGAVMNAALVAGTTVARLIKYGYESDRILHASLRVPVPPPSLDAERVRDAACLGGTVSGTIHLVVAGYDDAIAGCVSGRCSWTASRDTRLTAPVAELTVTDSRDGSVRRFGACDPGKALEHFGIRRRSVRPDRITAIR